MLLRSVAWAAIILALIAAHPGVASTANPITLIDQRGATFTFESLRGAAIIVTFVSAHCSDACPLIEAQVARCVERVAHRPLALRFLTVTLDPERDTPLDMRRLANAFDADRARWIFATGSRRDIHRLMTHFHVAAQRDRHGYASAHTSFVYVLDGNLNVQRTLIPSDDLSSQLLHESIDR